MHHFFAEFAAQKAADMRARAAAARAVRDARRQAPATGLRRLARRVSAAVAECNAAQRRLTVLTMSTDWGHSESGKAPETYAEFLARTAGPLLREPAAGRRLTGKPVH